MEQDIHLDRVTRLNLGIQLNKIFVNSFASLGVDALFRKINHKKLLLVTYHSVFSKKMLQYDKYPRVNNLPIDVFHQQITYLKKHYNIISLDELKFSIENGMPFRERSAMITFDDGYMNNYTLVFPILKKQKVHATIFLTTNYIGSDEMLWFDELFFIIKLSKEHGIDKKVIEKHFNTDIETNDILKIYVHLSSILKYISNEERSKLIFGYKNKYLEDMNITDSNYKLLTWEQVAEMKASGLIEFGIHTANHNILSTLKKTEYRKEILEPKLQLAEMLDCEIISFCYPNGKPSIDFTHEHEKYLQKCGYSLAFCTGHWLNTHYANPFRIGRMPTGNNNSSPENYFKLYTSGFIPLLKKMMSHN